MMLIGKGVGLAKADPTLTDPYWGNVVLMTGFNGVTLPVDESDNKCQITANGTVSINTTTTKFDGNSGYFPTASVAPFNSYRVSNSSTFAMGKGDFTIEMWINVVSGSFGQNGSMDIFCLNMHVNTDAVKPCSVLIQRTGGNNNYGLCYYDYNQFSGPANGYPMAAGTWYHVAVCRKDERILLCYNGTIVTAASYTTADLTATVTDDVRIREGGYSSGGQSKVSMYLDEVRVTKGYARYSGSSYTVPTTKFPRQ